MNKAHPMSPIVVSFMLIIDNWTTQRQGGSSHRAGRGCIRAWI